MTDLGIVMSGPIAQTGVTVFDEMWQGANQLICGSLIQGDLRALKKTCTWQPAETSHLPEILKYYLPGDTSNAIALYRTANFKESDEAYHAALASAQDSIDAIHANFTAELICDVNLLFPSVCTYENSLPYMQSLVDAVVQNGAHVRILVEKENMNGMENQVGVQILQDELKRRGLAGNLEIRFFKGRLHTKSVMIDNQLLIVGSQNFHYSSISEGGLNEFNIVTDAPEGLKVYQDMFEYYWKQASPVDETE
jgi:phosphatidylserine/phosphatidylglycerophosphate/cardiolipin synthase-like enzyme